MTVLFPKGYTFYFVPFYNLYKKIMYKFAWYAIR